jgi:hypothetical protein
MLPRDDGQATRPVPVRPRGKLAGTKAGSSVTFTWENPAPVDVYMWRPISVLQAGEYTSSNEARAVVAASPEPDKRVPLAAAPTVVMVCLSFRFAEKPIREWASKTLDPAVVPPAPEPARELELAGRT